MFLIVPIVYLQLVFMRMYRKHVGKAWIAV